MAAVLVVGIVTFSSTRLTLQRAVGSTQEEMARQTMNIIDHLLYERYKNIETMAGEKEFAAALSNLSPSSTRRLERRISDLSILTGPWDVLNLCAKSGIVVASSAKENQGHPYPVSYQVVFEEALKGQPAYSDLTLSRETGKPTILFAAPLREEDRQGRPVTGVLMGSFSWPALLEILDDLEAHATLVNSHGKVIGQNTRFSNENLMLRDFRELGIVKRALASQRASFVAPASQGFLASEVLASVASDLGYLSYKSQGWRLILEVPTTVAFADARQSAIRYALLFSVIILALGVSLLFFIIRFVVQPISRLNQVTTAITQGDLESQAEVSSRDEIGQLAQSFNAMTAKLRRSHEDLEHKVDQRTKELVDTNTLLKQQIVQRQQIEKRLKLSAENLARSNTELQDFASVASHDLQEPLRKVQVFSDRLKVKCAESLGEQGRDYLDRMRSAVARMQSLINDLLNYSRVTSKAQPFVPVAVEQVARDVVTDLEARIEQVQGRVEIGALPTLEADPMQMRQLLQNLIGNALKFHKKDVPPVIRVYAEALDGETGENPAVRSSACQLIVADNGIGFEEKYAERIFKVFERLHGREDYEGTGIGLAICRKIVERHGGSIIAKSAPHQGTTFIMTLPYQQTKGEPTSCKTTDESSPSLSPTMTPTTG